MESCLSNIGSCRHRSWGELRSGIAKAPRHHDGGTFFYHKLKTNNVCLCVLLRIFIYDQILNKMRDELLAVAFEIVNHWNLNHSVAAGLLAHRGTSHVDKHLAGEGGVVDAHVELKALVLRLAAHSLAN